MKVLHPCCCGLDVHKETVVACVRLVIDGKPVKEVRTFSTTTADLIALSEWLAETKCTHVAMEATGVYWKPAWHILSDGGFKLVLANAAHIKNVPGRKSDVKDADWISDLLAHGLIRASFVPDNATQEMRTLLRTRKQLVHEKARHILRIQKTLEDANIKLDSVITAPGAAWPRDRAPSLPVAPSPRTDRRNRCCDRQDRPGGGGRHWTLSHRRRASEFSAGHQKPCRAANPLRDRHRHEPLCQRCQSRLLGLHLPA